jgi:serine/threonine protein kinase
MCQFDISCWQDNIFVSLISNLTQTKRFTSTPKCYSFVRSFNGWSSTCHCHGILCWRYQSSQIKKLITILYLIVWRKSHYLKFFDWLGSLDKLLFDSNVKLSEEHKIRLVRGIAAGMLHLHKHNIIHRDLAARNILLSWKWTTKNLCTLSFCVSLSFHCFISISFSFLCHSHFIEHVKQIDIDNWHKFILLDSCV